MLLLLSCDTRTDTCLALTCCCDLFYFNSNALNVCITPTFNFSTSWPHTVARSRKNSSGKHFTGHGKRVKLATRFPCKTRKGMSCAVDTAWSKRGFDSLTCKLVVMSCKIPHD